MAHGHCPGVSGISKAVHKLLLVLANRTRSNKAQKETWIDISNEL